MITDDVLAIEKEHEEDHQQDKHKMPVWMHKWKSVIKYNKPIPYTNIIPCKVPLDSKYKEYCGKYDNFYNLDGLIKSLIDEGKQVRIMQVEKLGQTQKSMNK